MTTYPDLHPSTRENLDYFGNLLTQELRSRHINISSVHNRLAAYPLHPVVIGAYSHLMSVCDYERADQFFVSVMDECPTVSKSDGVSRIGYARTPEHLEADRWAVARPGGYIGRLLPDVFGGRAMDALVALCDTAETRLEWLDTTDDMIDYMTSARSRGDDFGSCMAYNNWDTHPYSVYDHSLGWSMARLMHGNQLVARALVYQKRGFLRIYSNSSRSVETLRAKLADVGVTQLDSWKGCLIRKVTTGRALIGPYVDGYACNARDNGNGTLTLSEDGPIYMQNTSGFADAPGYCSNDRDGMVETESGDWIDEDDAIYIDGQGTYHIDDCSRCSECEEWMLDGDVCRARDSRGHIVDLCESCRDEHFAYIGLGPHRNTFWHNDMTVWSDHHQEYLHCEDVVEIEGGDYVLISDATETHDGTWILNEDVVCLGDGRIFHRDDVIQVKVGTHSTVSLVVMS